MCPFQRVEKLFHGTFVKLFVLFVSDVVGGARPQRLDIIQRLVLPHGFILGFRRFLWQFRRVVIAVALFVAFVQIDFFLFALVVVRLGGGVFLLDAKLFGELLFVHRHFFLFFARIPQFNWKVDEFTVFANQSFQSVNTSVFSGVFFQVNDDLSATAQRVATRIFADSKRTISSRLPHLLFVVVVFRHDCDRVGHKKHRVETNTELTNQIAITVFLKFFQKFFCS
mmetsp:Transcript_6056/g.10388  ORF Transcript_6056/g.10388 Transcript_6056/m.10388 type:complete len:225 (-) Transcript_6056:506-1180(-)